MRVEDVDHGWVGEERRQGTLRPCPKVVRVRREVRRDPVSHGGQVVAEPGSFDLIGSAGSAFRAAHDGGGPNTPRVTPPTTRTPSPRSSRRPKSLRAFPWLPPRCRWWRQTEVPGVPRATGRTNSPGRRRPRTGTGNRCRTGDGEARRHPGCCAGADGARKDVAGQRQVRRLRRAERRPLTPTSRRCVSKLTCLPSAAVSHSTLSGIKTQPSGYRDDFLCREHLKPVVVKVGTSITELCHGDSDGLLADLTIGAPQRMERCRDVAILRSNSVGADLRDSAVGVECRDSASSGLAFSQEEPAAPVDSSGNHQALRLASVKRALYQRQRSRQGLPYLLNDTALVSRWCRSSPRHPRGVLVCEPANGIDDLLGSAPLRPGR